jgi:hypothetical protein
LGGKTTYFTLNKGHGLKRSKERVLKKILGHRGRKYKEDGEKCMMRSFMTFTPYPILLG